MNYSVLFNWMDRKLNLPKRIRNITIVYLLFLMVPTRKHSLQATAKFFNLSKSSFSKLLNNHCDLAAAKLCELSKRQAKQFGKNIDFIAAGNLPWKIAIIIDATLQRRTSLNAQNVKKFNHGKGFVIGHQWTNIVLFVNDFLIPLNLGCLKMPLWRIIFCLIFGPWKN